jgi:excisionase family DNA binding protein
MVEMDKLLFDIQEVSEITGLGRSLLYEKLRSGELRSVKVGRARRVSKNAIEDFVRALEDQCGN